MKCQWYRRTERDENKELTRNNTNTLENKKQVKEDIPFPAFAPQNLRLWYDCMRIK